MDIKMADLFDCSIDYLLGRTRIPVAERIERQA